MINIDNKFGALLKRFRTENRYSQLRLSLDAGISQRHISFLESGRSKPSISMIEKLARILKLNYSDINKLMVSHGQMPKYQEKIGKDEQVYLWQAIDFILESQMPYPTIIVDQHWDIVKSNNNANKLFAWLMDLSAEEIEATQNSQANILQLILLNNRLRPHIKNWAEITNHMIDRAIVDGLHSTNNIKNMIQSLPKAQQKMLGEQKNTMTAKAIIPIIYQKGDIELSLISMQTRFMTSQNIALSDLSIESFLPIDEVTKQFFTNF